MTEASDEGKALAGRVALVTGGCGGLGQATAERLKQAGATVIISDLDAEQGLEIAGALGVQFVQQDVSSEPAWRAVTDVLSEQYGGLDILVNNAAMFSRVPMSRVGSLEITETEWDKMMEINVKGVWNVCSAVVPVMKTQGYGKIVNISSGTALKGSPSRIHYVTSKAAVIGYTKSLAMEVGEHNVYVNCIAPGSTLSEEDPTPAIIAVREKAAASRCIKRVQTPEDLAGPIAFFVGPDSDFITGQTLVVDGGSCLH